MDSDEELVFTPAELSPVPQKKFKRLKKSRVSISEPGSPAFENPNVEKPADVSCCAAISDSFDGNRSRKTLDLENSADFICVGAGSKDFSDNGDVDLLELQKTPDSWKFSNSGQFDAGEYRFEDWKTSSVEEEAHLDRSDPGFERFDPKEARPDAENCEISGSGRKIDDVGVLDSGSKAGKSARKRDNSEGAEKEKKRKKKAKDINDNGNSEVSARNKKRIEKERQAHLERLHAESQRLLRETADASFKPVPIVQKPVSSVLAKIRLRKLEVQKKSGIRDGVILDGSDGPAVMDASSRDLPRNLYQKNGVNDVQCLFHTAEEDARAHIENAESSDLHALAMEDSVVPEILARRCENDFSNSVQAPNTQSKGVFRSPINDTQDLFGDSQLTIEEDAPEHPVESTLDEDVLSPSLLTMNLKLDSAPVDDDFSDEEDDNKENIDPRLNKPTDVDLYLKGDPVKAFVDDEAEEEDDSDNDRLRFQDNEEDEEDVENEELHDLIATGEEEMPIDFEKRDQLHQKWLEEQDAAATDNVLQRLRCGWKPRVSTLLHGEEDDEELGEDSADDDLVDLTPTRVVRKSVKKVKQMISNMFTDGEDVFMSSDDEEMDLRLERQSLLERTEEKASLLPPAEDEDSREVFGRIKKLNIAPDNKKRAKTAPSFFDLLVTGGNSNSSSRSSFLGRAPSNNMQSANKQGSTTVRSFIFGRDDSNSRSGISASDLSSDTLQDKKENQPPMNASSKPSFRQEKSKYKSCDPKIETVSNSGSTLFEVLRSSSINSDRGFLNKNQNHYTQAIDHFAAFKSAKRVVKIEKRNLLQES